MITPIDRILFKHMVYCVSKLDKIFYEIDKCYSKNKQKFNLCKIKYSNAITDNYKRGIYIKDNKVVVIDNIDVYSFEYGFIHKESEEVKLEVMAFVKELYNVYTMVNAIKRNTIADIDIRLKDERKKLNERYGR